MSTMTRLAIVMFTFVLAQSAWAQRDFVQPPAVTGISIEDREGDITVHWEAVSGVPIQFYRVYHSTESILEHDGIYDDFEVTEGPETSLIIKVPAHITELYAAVIAVSEDNLESEYFMEEGYINLLGEEEDASEDSDTDAKKNDRASIPRDGILHMLSAEATSPTSVKLMFSVPPTVEPSEAPQNLKITDQQGFVLRIQRLTIDQTEMVIETEEQRKGAVYRVDMGDAFQGIHGEPLDDVDRTYLFTSAGTKEGQKQPESIEARSPTSPPDIENLRIDHQVQADQTYNVTLQWETDNGPKDLLYHVVYQTRDGGQSFGPPGVLPIDIRGVQIPNVTAGPFGVVVQTVNVHGYTSQGVFKQVFLPYYVPGYGYYGANLVGEESEGPKDLEDSSAFAKAMADKEELAEDTRIRVLAMNIPQEQHAIKVAPHPIQKKTARPKGAAHTQAVAAVQEIVEGRMMMLFIGAIAVLVVLFGWGAVVMKRD